MAAGGTAWCLPARIRVWGTPAWGALSTPRWSRALVPAPSMPSVLGRGMLRGWIQKKKEAQTTGVCLGFAFGASFLELPWKCGLRALGAAQREPCAPRGCLGSGVPEPAGGVLGGGCAAMSVCRHGNLLQPRSPAPQGSLRRNVHPRVGVQNGGERERRGQRWRKREAGTGGDFVPG